MKSLRFTGTKHIINLHFSLQGGNRKLNKFP